MKNPLVTHSLFHHPFSLLQKIDRSRLPQKLESYFANIFLRRCDGGREGRCLLSRHPKKQLRTAFFGTFDLWMSGRESKVAFSFAFYGEPKLL